MDLGKRVLPGEEGPEQCRGWSLLLLDSPEPPAASLPPFCSSIPPSISPGGVGMMSKQVPSHHPPHLISPSRENPKLDQPAQPGLQGLNQQKPPEPGVLRGIEILGLQHRNKPLRRSWEGKAGEKAGSSRESLAGRRIWPCKSLIPGASSQGQGLGGDITEHPQPWGGSSPCIPTQDGGRNTQGFAHALCWCFPASLFHQGTNPSLTSPVVQATSQDLCAG